MKICKSFVRLSGAAVLLLALALVGSACNPADAPVERSSTVFGNGPCQVGVVGDSLTVGADRFGSIRSVFEDQGCEVLAVDAREGRPTSEGATVVESWAASGTMPRILVVALGTNDCSAETFRRHVARIMAAAGPDRPVVWVNTWRAGCDVGINRVINNTQLGYSQRPDDGNLWIVDFHGWVSLNQGVLSRDRVHLTADGYRQHARRIVDAVVR